MRLALILSCVVALAAAISTAPTPPRSHVRVLEAEALRPGLRGRPLARLPLASRLDAFSRAVPIEIEGRRWLAGFAADARFDRFFAVFTRRGRSSLDALTQPRAFLHHGVVLSLDSRHAYLFRVRPRRWAPLTRSRVMVLRLNGLLVASWTSGELVDALLQGATKLATDQGNLWLAYLSDRDPATGRKSGRRSLLFLEPRHFFVEAWSLPATALSPLGVAVDVGGARLSLRLFGGVLLVEEI